MATSTEGKRATHPAFIQFSAPIQPFIGISKDALAHNYNIMLKFQVIRTIHFLTTLFLDISGDNWLVFGLLLVHSMNFSTNAFKHKIFRAAYQKITSFGRTNNDITTSNLKNRSVTLGHFKKPLVTPLMVRMI